MLKSLRNKESCAKRGWGGRAYDPLAYTYTDVRGVLALPSVAHVGTVKPQQEVVEVDMWEMLTD